MSASPTTNSKMERRLTLKSKELNDMREKFLNLESSEHSLQSKVDKLERQVWEKNETMKNALTERDNMERDLTHYVTEVNVRPKYSMTHSFDLNTV